MSRLSPVARPLAALVLACGIVVTASAQPAAGWTAEFTVRVESAGKRPPTGGLAWTDVRGAAEWSSTHELRGTLAYTQRLRGAPARNQPDRDNEQRYESWLARGQDVPAALTLHHVRSETSSGRVRIADGEGAAAVNRANAGKIGKVEHLRSRTEVKVDAADGARMGGAYLQIDRVANQVRFEVPSLWINHERARILEQRVSRLGAPAAAGEWDRNESFTPASSQQLRTQPLLPSPVEFVFDVPAASLAEGKEITLTQDFKPEAIEPEPTVNRGVVRITLRRVDAAARAIPAAATAAAPGAGAAPVTAAAQAAPTPAPAAAEPRKVEPAPPAAGATPTVQDAAKAVERLRGLFGR